MTPNERIADLRMQAGISRAELARRIGTSDVTICYWENGKVRNIGHDHLLRLATVFGVSVSHLLNDPMDTGDVHDAGLLIRWAERLEDRAEGDRARGPGLGEAALMLRREAKRLRDQGGGV